MLKIDAGSIKKCLTVEISTHTDLDALQVLHQHKVGATTICRMVAVHGQQCQHVGTVVQLADVVARTRTVGSVELEHVTSALQLQKSHRFGIRSEAVAARSLQADAAQDLLPELTISLQPVTERAAANDLKTCAAQLILLLALDRRFKNGHAVLTGIAQPFQLSLPVINPLQHAAEHVVAGRVFNKYPNLMATRGHAVVHGSQIVVFADAQKSHDRQPL